MCEVDRLSRRTFAGLAIAVLVAAGGGGLAYVLTNGGREADPTLWSAAQAERNVVKTPPPEWTRRGWQVDLAECTGLGPAHGHRERRRYRRFSCEITVVKPSGDCPSTALRVCVAGFEATALERKLQVLGDTRYAVVPPR